MTTVEPFLCVHCGRSSAHPDDAAHRYCGACHHFCDDVPVWRYLDTTHRTGGKRVKHALPAQWAGSPHAMAWCGQGPVWFSPDGWHSDPEVLADARECRRCVVSLQRIRARREEAMRR